MCHRKGTCDFRTIEKAVKKARAGDTVRVRKGTYHEAVMVSGAKKRYLRLLGDVKHPKRVVLDGDNKKANGVFVSGADQVTVRGFKARDYKSNGFFVVNATGYTLRNLIAQHTGVYGLYAFNTKGGLMADSEAYYLNAGAFYIGQTPPQAKPRRSIVRNVSGHSSAIGFSATNMRYVTITKSRFYDNALGVVPNALDSEKYPPPEDNVITDNDIFWNNFDFHKGAPFTVRESGTAALAPVGTGVLLLGGRGNRVEGNRIFGNYLAGVGAIDGILVSKHPDAIELQRNTVRDNSFGRGGRDLNGRDVIYDGSGTGNCFGPNTVLSPSPDTAPLQPCPFGDKNAFDQAARDRMLSWIGESALNGWIKHPHAKKKGVKPLEIWKGKPRAAAASTRRKTVHIGDNYFTPHSLKVRKGTRVTWKWPGFDSAGDVHDVKLKSRPKGAKRFHSEPQSADYRYTRKLTVPGTYRIVCTLHEDMRMKIVVRK